MARELVVLALACAACRFTPGARGDAAIVGDDSTDSQGLGDSRDATPPGVVAWVQSQSTAANPWPSSASTVAVAIAVTSGDVLAVYLSYDANVTLDSVSDTVGNAYTIVDTISNAPDRQKSSTAYAKNITGGAATVTANFSATNCCRVMIVQEISGADLLAPLDGNSSRMQLNPGAGVNAVTTGPMTTTADGDYIFGATSDSHAIGSQMITAGTGETMRSTVAPTGGNATAAEERHQTVGGSITSAFTFSVAGGSSLTMQMAFRP